MSSFDPTQFGYKYDSEKELYRHPSGWKLSPSLLSTGTWYLYLYLGDFRYIGTLNNVLYIDLAKAQEIPLPAWATRHPEYVYKVARVKLSKLGLEKFAWACMVTKARVVSYGLADLSWPRRVLSSHTAEVMLHLDSEQVPQFESLQGTLEEPPSITVNQEGGDHA